MIRSYYFVAFLCLVFGLLHQFAAVPVNKIPIASPNGPNKIYSMEEALQICDQLKEKGSIIRCVDPRVDVTLPAKKFLKNAAAKGRQVVTNPVVFIPGFGGSALEAQLNKPNTPAWYCFQTWDWFRIWLALSELFVQDCWTDNLNLVYSPNNDSYANTEGVDIRGIDWGGTSGIDYLDYVLGFPLPFTSVYAGFVENLQALGYQSGINLRGAPYDFRLPPDEHLRGLYPHLKELIEDTYRINNNTKVHIVSHSLGGPTFVYFLNQMRQDWKDQYIASFIPIAGPWAGSSKALRAAISGDDLGISLLDFSLADKLKFRKLARHSGGLITLFPDPVFWTDEVFVRTSRKNYTVDQIGDLLNDIGAPLTSSIYKNVVNLLPSMQPPTVLTHCIYGTNYSTELSYYYPDDNFDADPIITYTSSGDGTVPEKSLEECSNWAREQTQPVIVQEFNLREHLEILADEEVIAYVANIVTAPPSK